ncbi:hypothetical protein [Chitinophaga sp.]|uniref:hypothetical protein n=1 Tax=Chitinophaga sp. TaxID=1869181 RepID=UPI0025BA8F5E|nr:hypothetical protein [Chitinophaga sp.]
MKSCMKFIPALMLVAVTFGAHAQSDSALKSKIIARPVKTKKPTSQVGLELVYKTYTSSYYNFNSHTYSSNTYTKPFVRINGAKPVALDKKGEMLRKYYTKCPLAMAQLDEFRDKNKKASRLFWGGFGAAGVMTIGGLVLSTKVPEDKSTATFFASFGVGVGTMLAGGIASWILHRRADEHLRSSVDVYNRSCYIPPKPDSTQIASTSSSFATEGKVKASPQKNYVDTVLYELVRNEPAHSNLFGISVHPVVVDAYKPNLSISGGVGVFYTYRSAFGVSLNTQIGYLENMDGIHGSDKPSYESYGVPVKNRASKRLELQTKFTLHSWTKEIKYPMHISYSREGEMSGSVPGTMVRAITGRLGFIHDLKKIEGNGMMPLETSKTPYVLHMDDGTDQELGRTGLKNSTVLLQSEVITAGIALSTFRDMKINLKDEQYRGKRDLKAQTDLFIDVMYAPSMKYEDLLYSYHVYQANQMYEILPVTSSFSRTGARVGYQSMSMGKFFGTKYIIELGLRPGPTLPNSANAYFQLTYGVIFGGRQNNF